MLEAHVDDALPSGYTFSKCDALAAHHGEHCVGTFIDPTSSLADASPQLAEEKEVR
jgi:hypothetical protein